MAPPKKKGQAMSLSEFASMVESEAPTSKASWADDEFELPSAPMAAFEELPSHPEYDRNFVRGTGGRGQRDMAPPPPPSIDYSRLPTTGPFNVFVGNLPFDVSEADIRAAFPADISIVGVKIPKDQDQRPRGFAYMELGNQDSLIKALLASGAQLKGRYIRVDISEGRQQDKSFASDWRSGVEHQVSMGSSGRPNFDNASLRGPERVFDRSMMQPVVAESRPAANAWRTTAQPVAAERPKSTSSDVSLKSNPPTIKKPVLNLLPRSKPVGSVPEPAAVYEGKASPFGAAKPVNKAPQENVDA